MIRYLRRACRPALHLSALPVLAVGLLSACGGGSDDLDKDDPSNAATSGGQAGIPSGGGGDAMGPNGTGSTGGLAVTPGNSGGSDGVDETSCGNVGENVLRRLSRLEYQLTLQDLFQLPEPPEIGDVPEDVEREGFTSFAAIQLISPAHLRSYLDVATSLIDDVLQDEDRIQEVIGCELNAPDCLDEFIQRFGRLSYRRTVDVTESATLANRATSDSSSLEDSFRYAAQVMLTSPHFIFRVEVGDQMEGLSELTPLEVASKLSFTLWARGPSAALLDRAENGDLDDEAGFAAVALEMLTDDKAKQFYATFFPQWLTYQTMRAPTEVPDGWDERFLSHMVDETDALIEEYAWTEGKDFLELLTANHTHVSRGLAQYYDLPAPAMGETKVEIPDDHPRAHSGILTHGALLSAKGDGDKISIRGNWLRNTFLCKNLEIPESVANSLGDILVGLNRIQIIEKRNEQPTCKGCHSVIDPIGVGFAAFDQTGRFDESVDLSDYPLEPGFPDHDSPEFTSIAELSAKLAEMPEVAACITERAFLFARGRDPENKDSCTVEDAAGSFEGAGNSFSQLVQSLVEAEAFRLRRAPQL